MLFFDRTGILVVPCGVGSAVPSRALAARAGRIGRDIVD